MPSPELLWCENMLARAHKLLWSTANEIDRIGYRTLSDDIDLINKEIERIQEDLLKGRKRP